MPSAHPPLSSRVVVFGRAGCHLCDDAQVVVGRVCEALREPWTKVSIDDDPALLTAYGELIPVVMVDGREVARYRITDAELRSALRVPHRS
jgi:hypothetical protein